MSQAQAAPPASTKWVYRFGGGDSEGSAQLRDLLGGKGANLAEMANLGLPVPPGFTITTEVCTAWYANGGALPDGLKSQVEAALDAVGEAAGRRFDDVPPNHWAHDDVEELAALGIVKGEGPRTFDPDGQTTRAEVATLIARAIRHVEGTTP